MNSDPKTTSTTANDTSLFAHLTRQTGLRRLGLIGALLLSALGSLPAAPAYAQDIQSAPSFVDDFKSFDRSRWYVSDGWNNGSHQNCTWS